MIDELMLGEFHNGLVIRDCLEKLRHFCEFDAFPHYDAVGYKYAHESDRFQSELLTAMNKAMMARSSRKAWAPLLDRPLRVLADVPVNVDLIETAQTAYHDAREKVRACYMMLTDIKWITDMAASKMLHLKRPRLVAISDSYVRDMLKIGDPDTRIYPWRASFLTARALSVGDAVREIGQANMGLLQGLQREMSPLLISKARIMDILIWVEMGVAQGHPQWSYAAKLKGWTCSVGR